MKFFISILFLAISLSVCKAQENSYQLETKLYDCIVDYNKSMGIDLEAKLDSIHSFFVNKGVLKDYSGKSIIELIKKINKDGDIPDVSNTTNISLDNTGYMGASLEDICNGFDTAVLSDTTFKLSKLTVATARMVNLNPKEVSEMLLNIFIAKDFEHPFYRTLFLTVAFSIADRETGIKESLPPIPDSENIRQLEKGNIFEVYVGEGDTLLVKGKFEKLANLKRLAKSFIVTHNTIGIISLTNSRATSYEFYVKVHDTIKSAYKEIRDEYAKDTFGKPFDKLSTEEKSIVREVFPQKISEAEPRN